MFSAMSAPKLWGCHQRWKTDPEIAACRIARQIRLSLISSSDFRPGLYGRRKRLERTFINGSPLQGSTAFIPESDRKTVGEGKSVSVRLYLCGRSSIIKKIARPLHQKSTRN